MAHTVHDSAALPALAEVAREIGEGVAGPAAEDVDARARPPLETIAALRDSGLLAALVPGEWGGPGGSVAELAEAVCALAEYCASSGLVLAMHGIQVATVARHGRPETLARVMPALAAGELLLANANSEVGLGGDRRRSLCALVASERGFRLEKHASTVSYGECADGVLATARRTPDAPEHEQALAICLAPDFALEPEGEWDTLGLRGTVSRPARLRAEVDPELIIEDYAGAFAQTTLPTSAILLGAVWLGIAEAAARRAHAAVREQGRRGRALAAGVPPPSALRLAELAVVLHEMRAVLRHGAAEYERVKDTDELATFAVTSQMDSVKIATSTLVGDIVRDAMAICGLAGYANRSALSIARLARDAAAAPLMVGNERALTAAAQALLVRKTL